ncbi:adhesion defective protein 1 [Trichoderma asperellum]|uniref:Adhesion defective protein 1 n=1 Tax=Trichoderma asperellum TaxID=101201 RepID=A0A6V8R2F2_TRIAP|nr:adhesion defective protein 1 [Trichoderma asperellum]
MAASMGPNFAGHPGMGHPGVAGHPMAGPGMQPNAGQQGAPGGMPHQFAGSHIAVSGPGGQVNPALMGGMPPGATPNPHPMHQLSPAQQQQMFQHQQQQLQQQFGMNNPSAMAAIRQQHILQQQQRQALMAQQFPGMTPAGVNGMPMGMQLTPQQIHQLRQARNAAGLGHAHNPQAIMAQQLALQQQAAAQAQQQAAQQQAQQQQQQQAAQQQAAHNQQMAAGHNQAQHMTMNAQPMPGMPQPNPMATQPSMGAQQQPGQQPPGQPQPQPQQQPGPQSQPTPQQASQAGTPAPTGQQTPQTPAPTPAQANQMQQGQPQPQQAHPPNQTQMAAVATQQLMANTMMQQQQQQLRETMKTRCLLRLMHLSECLSTFPGAKSKEDLPYWGRVVSQFFSSPNGVFRHSLHVSENEDAADKQYEIAYPVIARYFHTYFSSGVKSIQLILDGGSIDKALPGDCYCIENQRASFVYWFESGSHLVASGTLRAQFDAEQKIELFEFLTTGHEEFVSMRSVIEAAKPTHEWIKEWRTVNTIDGKQSPEMSKKGKARQLKSPQKEPPGVLVDLNSAVNKQGVTPAVHQFLEIVEVMGQMNPLIGFYNSNPGLTPYGALEQYVATQINSATPVMNGQAMAQGPRTPGFGQFPMGASPAAVHMNLPGSPHIGSPAPGQAPGMQLQPSQQGTSSSGPSANTSPASNKRRRPSTVKVEDDSIAPGAGQVNGVQSRVKPQTPRMAKRVKGNPA